MSEPANCKRRRSASDSKKAINERNSQQTDRKRRHKNGTHLPLLRDKDGQVFLYNRCVDRVRVHVCKVEVALSQPR